MDDLIRRQDVTNYVLEHGFYCDTEADKEYTAELIRTVFPSVDAVEVVRCRDCKYAEYDHEAKYDGQKWYLCRFAWGQFNSETHFCSHGERKTDG